MPAISAVITTYNNAATLQRCLISAAAVADEVLVLDSFSDDATVQIATDCNAHVVQETFRGYGPQKKRAVDLAKHDWVLLLDADEELSEALQAEILTLENRLEPPGYRLQRREWLAWKTPIEQHGRWQHPWVKKTDHLRLFDRRIAQLSEHPVHAAPHSKQPALLLKNDLLHWGDAPFQHRREKARQYARLGAGIGSRWQAVIKLPFAPLWAFFQDYFLRRGFMNPWLGLAAAMHSAYASFLKYWYRLKHPRRMW